MTETAKQRITRVAIALFAERGYAGTSVAEIQQAAGLAPGSGALYKHFRSKQELLAAAIDWHINDIEQASGELSATLPADPGKALKIVMARLLAGLADNAAMVRITLRDLDARPELADRIADEMMAGMHNAIAGWLAAQVDEGKLRPHDTDAVAAVLLSSASYYRVVDILLGKAPAEVSEDRLVDAVVDLVTQGLVPAAA